ncbi:MAG: hypothetical protein AB1938_20530 [Myxococcota bacterium]
MEARGLARFLVERVQPRSADALASLRLGDLFLAWACLEGQRAALTEFEAEVMPQVERAARRAQGGAGVAAEIANATRARLLVADGDRRPGLTQYTGTGPLASFAMVVAMRLAVDLHRQGPPEQTLEGVLLEACDPRWCADDALTRAAIAPVVQRALVSATAALSPRERTLLKLHVVQGVSAQALGRMYRVHRATTTRWLADARKKVLAEMTAGLRRELAVGDETLGEMMGVLLGGLELTLSGVFTGAEEPPA